MDFDLAGLREPYFNCGVCPPYARRILNARPDWNKFGIYSLYPVTLTKLERVISVVAPVIDLYPVFSDSGSNANLASFNSSL